MTVLSAEFMPLILNGSSSRPSICSTWPRCRAGTAAHRGDWTVDRVGSGGSLQAAAATSSEGLTAQGNGQRPVRRSGQVAHAAAAVMEWGGRVSGQRGRCGS